MATDDTSWLELGKCRDMPVKTFFPSDAAGVDSACCICAGCPVKERCLEYALASRIDQGVWGGTSERQRRRLRRELRGLLAR